MSRKTVSITVSVLGRSLLALAFVVAAAQSCGSSSSSDGVALCQQGCDKSLSCMPDAGAAATATDMECKQSCTAEVTTAPKCTNAAAIESAYKACLAMDCANYVSCLLTVPTCVGGTGGSGGTGAAMAGTNGGGAGAGGRGGTNGGGAGTNGAGGATAGSCSTCAKAQPCCVAAFQLLGADAGGCSFSTATCNTLTGAAQSSYVSDCSAEITAGAELGVAACM